MSYNAASRKDIRAAEKSAKALSMEEAEVLVTLLSDIPGRRYVWNQLARAHIFQTSVVSTDPIMIAFLEGERNQGLKLLNDILAHCPHLFLEMIQEHNAANLAKENTDVERGHDEPDAPDAGSDSED